MKSILTLVFLGIVSLCSAQDDYCICMLDQPAYEAPQDDSFVSVHGFGFISQTTSSDEPLTPLILIPEELDEDITIDDEGIENEESTDETADSPPHDKATLKKKKRYPIPHWNAHRKPKKYKGKCPFF